MRKLIAFALVGGLLGCGCSMLGFGGGGGGGGGMDMAKMAADNQQASYIVALHKGAEVGHWCEWTMGTMKQWWGVTDKKGDNLVVENRNIMEGMQLTTTAYVVDADGNVLEAYVANWDPKAEKLSNAHKMKIMAKPADQPAGEAPKSETGEESVNTAGKDWACKWTKTEYGKSWMCDDAWFNKMIQSADASGNVAMKLTACGTDAKRGFEWPTEEKAAN